MYWENVGVRYNKCIYTSRLLQVEKGTSQNVVMSNSVGFWNLTMFLALVS